MYQLVVMMIVFLFSFSLYGTNFLTIYNQNQALYMTQIEIELKNGVHFYSHENIPTGIIRESVIFLPKDKEITLFSQNFEYDLANSEKTIQKYINKNVKLTTDVEKYSGILIFYDKTNFGLLSEKTSELNIISANKVNNILLSEMPSDFYTKPTLRWQLSAPQSGKFKADLSYLTTGIEWRATYNAVLNKDNMILSSWVTINNRSGKDYQNVTLKLIAGDVLTQAPMIRGRAVGETIRFATTDVQSAPVFEERAFSDYRLYTLDKTADIDNNQEKQLMLYPLKSIKVQKNYEYVIGGNGVDVLISFKNSQENGLGVPLPAGNIIFYETDEKDGTNQFVGGNRINHTSLNQELSLKIGVAFDIVPVTKTLSSNTSGATKVSDYEVNLTNNKSEAIEITVIRRISPNAEIIKQNIFSEKKDSNTYIFKMKIGEGKTEKLTFTERIRY